MPTTSGHASGKLPKKLVDERPLLDAIDGVYLLPAILVAHKLGLFETIGRGALTADEIESKIESEGSPDRGATRLRQLARLHEREPQSVPPDATWCKLSVEGESDQLGTISGLFY